MKKWILGSLIGLVALFLIAQVIPYGRNHKNPAVAKEPAWDSPQTRALAKNACFDCHSNLTKWPWYSNVAPVSWVVYRMVKSGREKLNFSEWQRSQGADAAEIVKSVRDKKMPYWPKHLSSAEREQLANGLEKTLAQSPPGG